MRYWISGFCLLLTAMLAVVLLVPGLFDARIGWLSATNGVLLGLSAWSLATARP